MYLSEFVTLVSRYAFNSNLVGRKVLLVNPRPYIHDHVIYDFMDGHLSDWDLNGYLVE